MDENNKFRLIDNTGRILAIIGSDGKIEITPKTVEIKEYIGKLGNPYWAVGWLLLEISQLRTGMEWGQTAIERLLNDSWNGPIDADHPARKYASTISEELKKKINEFSVGRSER